MRVALGRSAAKSDLKVVPIVGKINGTSGCSWGSVNWLGSAHVKTDSAQFTTPATRTSPSLIFAPATVATAGAMAEKGTLLIDHSADRGHNGTPATVAEDRTRRL